MSAAKLRKSDVSWFKKAGTAEFSTERPWGTQPGWKWPSRNSGFSPWKMVIFPSYVNVYHGVHQEVGLVFSNLQPKNLDSGANSTVWWISGETHMTNLQWDLLQNVDCRQKRVALNTSTDAVGRRSIVNPFVLLLKDSWHVLPPTHQLLPGTPWWQSKGIPV